MAGSTGERSAVAVPARVPGRGPGRVLSPAAEPRPLLHVTPPSGWLNDPVGGLVHRGRQHLFFQHVPAGTEWRPGCSWGHLVGDDLVRWRHLPVALAPGPDDDGVWSGSAVVDAAGPVLLYTSVLDGRLELGRIALARPADEDLLRWHKQAGGPVLEPPVDLDLSRFRDPFVWGVPGGWRMLVGAGLPDRGGAVLRFSGPDLREWRLDGVLADSGGPAGGLGEMWECPQYVDLGGRPALIVSVMRDGRLDRVTAARGREEHGRFRPDRWDTLGHGGSAYALTTYRDRAGRLVGTAWLRDGAAATRRVGWAGMLSLPVLLTAGDDGGIHLAPHPDVDTLREERLARGAARVELSGRAATAGLLDLAVGLRDGAGLRLDGDGGPVVFTAAGTELRVDSSAGPTVVGVPAVPELALRVVVDRGVVEAWTGDGRWLAVRVPGLHVRAATVLGGGRLDAWRLGPAQPPAGG